MGMVCEIYGHKMVFDSTDASGPSTCRRCGHKEPAIKWPTASKPKPYQCESCKKGFDGTNGNGYQPCGCG